MKVIDKLGIPQELAWGYLGILIFMMGDGMEQGWLSPYLIDRDMTIQQSASLFSFYGIAVAASSWLSGVLAEGFGVKKTMLTGLIIYLLGTLGFVGYALPELDYSLMLLTYTLRGFGYPLFAYSFLVWITYCSKKESLGRAVGWFWFVFTGGLIVLGAYYSSWAIGYFGHINTLWSAIAWVMIGAFLSLVLVKDQSVNGVNGSLNKNIHEFLRGLTIAYEKPKIFLGGLVRMINSTAHYAFPVFLPTYMFEYGFETTEWLQIWGTIFTVNIVFNLIFGFVGDSLGWRLTVMWFGGVGCGVSTLFFYYSPQLFNGSFWAVTAAGSFWGAMLAGYVPLSALVPSLVLKEKGAAMASLNFGAGLAVFVGPAIVGLFIGVVGNSGVIWMLAILYFLGAILTKYITLPLENKTVVNGYINQ